MTMTIGRCAINEDPYEGTMRAQGNRVSFDTDVNPSTLTVNEFDARMHQLLGLLDNPEEPVAPFTWTEDTMFDGFYRVKDLSLDWNAATLTTGACPLHVELEKVGGGFARTQFETILQQVLRTNDHGITTPHRVSAAYLAPSAYTWADVDFGTLTSISSNSFTSEDGAMTSQYVSSGGVLDALAYWRVYLKPGDYYKGAAKLEVKYGSTWYPVHGRQLPLGTAGNWRISNGFARMYPTQITANGRFTVEKYTGAAWYGREFYLGQFDNGAASWLAHLATGDTANGLSTPVVLVNTPSLVVVRCASGGYTYDFAIRTGDSWVEVTATWPSSAVGVGLHQAMGLSVPETTTAFIGGIRATNNDANGIRYLIASPRTVTTDAANSRLRVPVDTYRTMTWQVTSDYRNTPNGTGQSDTNNRDMFLAIRNEARRVIAR